MTDKSKFAASRTSETSTRMLGELKALATFGETKAIKDQALVIAT